MSKRQGLGRIHLVRARGPLAHFCGISLGPERHTMLVPSHSACVGICRSVIDKRELRFHVEALSVHARSEVFPMRINELRSFESDGSKPLDIVALRTQRVRTFLREVDYLLRVRIGLSSYAQADDSVEKFDAMFERRLRSGTFRWSPYLGLRECKAYVSYIGSDAEMPPVVDVSFDYGVSFFDKDMDTDGEPAYLAPLKVDRGVVRYPSFDDVRKLGMRYELPRVA